jgi:hypothetical protein
MPACQMDHRLAAAHRARLLAAVVRKKLGSSVGEDGRRERAAGSQQLQLESKPDDRDHSRLSCKKRIRHFLRGYFPAPIGYFGPRHRRRLGLA